MIDIFIYVMWPLAGMKNESNRLVSFSLGNSGIPENDVFPKANLARGSITFENTQWRYSPRNESGVDATLHADIKAFPIDGVMVMVMVGGSSAFEGRLTGYSYTETGAQVTFELQWANWRSIQRADISSVYEGYSFKDLASEYLALGDVRGNAPSIASSPVVIPYAWVGRDNALTDLMSLADVTLGIAYQGDTGAFLLDAYDTWYTNAVKSVPLSPDLNYTDMETSWSSKRMATEIVVDYAPRDTGLVTTLYELDEWLYCPANVDGVPEGVSKTFILKAAKPIYLYSTPELDTDYGISLGSGVDPSADVTIEFVMYAQEIHVTITNKNEYLEAIMEWFVLSGVAIVGQPSRLVELEFNPVANFKRVRNIASRFYIQSETHAQWLANVGAQRLARRDIGVRVTGIPVSAELMTDTVGNALLNLGTHVLYKRFHDATAPTHAHVVGSTLRYSAGKLSLDLVLINRDVLYPREDYAVLSTSGVFPITETVFC